MGRPLRPGPNWLQIALTALALAIGLSLRLYVLREHPPWDSVYSDMGGYVDNANRILKGKLIPETFFQPVGFPALLALLEWLGLGFKSLGMINVVAGTLTAFFAGRIAAHVAGEWTAVLTTWVVSTHFSAAYLGGFYMGETVYSFVLTFACWIAARTQLRAWWAALSYSVLIAGSYWLKGYAGPMVGLIALFFLLRAWEQPALRKVWLRNVALISLLFIAQPLAHREVTQRTIGVAQAGPSTAGLNLVEGKCPWKRNYDSRGYSWWSPLYVQQGKGKVKHWDRPFTDAAYFQQQAIECIKRRPYVLVESFRNISELFVRNHLWPWDNRFIALEKKYEIGFLVFLFPGMLVGLLRLAETQRARRHLFGLAVLVPLVTICAVVYVGKSEIRYRVPFDPLFIVVASAGWVGLLAGARRLWRSLRTTREPSPPAPAAEG